MSSEVHSRGVLFQVVDFATLRSRTHADNACRKLRRWVWPLRSTFDRIAPTEGSTLLLRYSGNKKLKQKKKRKIELRGNVLAVRAALDASGELRFEDLHRSNFMA